MLQRRYPTLLILLFLCTCVRAQTNDEFDYSPSDRQLTATERTYGLVQFWTEAKYNFAYFDQVPELNWDAALQEYLPLVQNAEDDDAYYRLLAKFCALLKNVNTTLSPPKHLAGNWDRPPLGIELLEDVPVVVNRSIEVGKKVPLGAQITAVNQVPLEKHLEENVYPYITASGDQVRRRWAAHDLLKGPAGSEVSFTFQTLEGEQGIATLARTRSTKGLTWEIPRKEWFMTKFEMLDDQVGYLTLNSFKDPKAVEEFLEFLPEIRKCRKLVIDLRMNMAGNSAVAYDILKYFTTKPILSSSWRTREHRSAHWAWGKAVSNEDPETLNEWDRNNQKMYLGEVWHVVPSDTIHPATDPIPEMPVAVLMSNYTSSGAEKFLVAADVLENFVFIGAPSFGNTIQPLTLSLPGGGSATICAKRDTYPDGRVFVGPGVGVDVKVAPSIKDHLDERDVVLAKALEILK
jgi:C-terminal processing protease CtpA/Prc